MTGRLNHSSLVSGMLLAGSSTLQVLKSLWPPPRSLPSLGSQLLGSFQESSYSPGTLKEVAGLKINPVTTSGATSASPLVEH